MYFSIKLSFPQLQWKKIFSSLKTKSSYISPLKSLLMSLAARIGVGAVAGVALAIYIGGPGTILWIWIISLITVINSFVENYLGLKYQNKNSKTSGPYYYIEKGLNNYKLATIYALLVIIAYIIGFMSIQANTITVSINSTYNINKVIIAYILSLVSFISIFKGLKSIINITSKIIPLLGLIYIFLGIVIIFSNINILPTICKSIINSAFNTKSFLTSFIPCFLIGIKRGIFASESGLGTSSIASGTVITDDKIKASFLQVLGIYFTIFIICTITALIVLSSNYETLIINNINGIELIEYSLNYHFGNYSDIVLIIIVVILAYSTIIAGYYYGESSLNYLIGYKEKYNFLLKIITALLLFFGSLLNPLFLWKLIDVLVCILAIINMYALLKLRKEVIIDYKKSK